MQLVQERLWLAHARRTRPVAKQNFPLRAKMKSMSTAFGSKPGCRTPPMTTLPSRQHVVAQAPVPKRGESEVPRSRGPTFHAEVPRSRGPTFHAAAPRATSSPRPSAGWRCRDVPPRIRASAAGDPGRAPTVAQCRCCSPDRADSVPVRVRTRPPRRCGCRVAPEVSTLFAETAQARAHTMGTWRSS